MKTLSTTNGCIKTQAAVLLYMLNLQKGRNFEVDCDGKKTIRTSGENGLVKLKNGNRGEYAVKVTDSNDTKYFVEPFMVESFPDSNHILSFRCKNTLMSGK